MSGRKVLVLGGTGLISGPVARQLSLRGDDVTIFHRGTSALPKELPMKEILGDRFSGREFVRAVREQGPWDAIVDIIGGTGEDAEHLVSAARGVAGQVLFCSTTSVYRRPFSVVPVTEKNAACGADFPYGANKLAAETVLQDAARRGEFALTILRPGHTYNERSLVVHSLGNRTSHLDRLVQGRPVVVHGDGCGLWSCVWADDVAAAIVAAVGSVRAMGKSYHLAGREWFSWNDYHRALAEALGVLCLKILPIPVEELAVLAPNRTGQCLRTLRFPGVYDCSAAATDLGFAPQISMAEGLARNVAWLREQGRIESWQADGEYEEIVTLWSERSAGACPSSAKSNASL